MLVVIGDCQLWVGHDLPPTQQAGIAVGTHDAWLVAIDPWTKARLLSQAVDQRVES
jgi:hypothetical protein